MTQGWSLPALRNAVCAFQHAFKCLTQYSTCAPPDYGSPPKFSRDDSFEVELAPELDAIQRQHNLAGTPLSNEEEHDSMMLLQASPLVIEDLSTSHPDETDAALIVASLEGKHERTALAKIVQVSGSEMSLRFRHLSTTSLGETLLQTHKLLHLSAHGLFMQSGEYALVLENASGSAELLSMHNLRQLLRSANPATLPSLVFVSACHSQIAGELFVEAGVEHVICIKANERVLDLAARQFTSFFYMALLQGHTVKRAFEIACINVDVAVDVQRRKSGPSSGTRESEKFMLLPSHDVHQVSLFRRPTPCVPTSPFSANPRPARAMEEHAGHLPAPTHPFVGRQAEVQQVVGLLQHRRCVSITGSQKSGKTSVAKAACHFLNDRHVYADGVFWLDMATLASRTECAAALVAQAHHHISTEEAQALTKALNAPDQLFHASKDSLCRVLLVLSHWDTLICLDNCGGALGNHLVLEFLQHTTNIRILTTSCVPPRIPVENGVSLGTVRVKALCMRACLELVHRICPWLLLNDDQHQTKFAFVQALIRQHGQSPYHIRLALKSYS